MVSLLPLSIIVISEFSIILIFDIVNSDIRYSGRFVPPGRGFSSFFFLRRPTFPVPEKWAKGHIRGRGFRFPRPLMEPPPLKRHLQGGLTAPLGRGPTPHVVDRQCGHLPVGAGGLISPLQYRGSPWSAKCCMTSERIYWDGVCPRCPAKSQRL